ncbi:MAG: hypothetical protein AB4058_07845 [Microcystaceae cyanobacterium]
MNQPTTTSNGLDILDHRYYQNDPDRQLELEKARLDDKVAREIMKLKEHHHLSNQDLANLINIEESLIEALENADYEGDAFLLLNRIASALKMTVKIELIAV